jgi:hypothetical protein
VLRRVRDRVRARALSKPLSLPQKFLSHRKILFIAPHLWMNYGWMKKVVDKVKMSYIVNMLKMMLKFVLDTDPQGRKCQLRLLPPPLLLFLEVIEEVMTSSCHL